MDDIYRSSQLGKPKVYTRSETTKEEVVSRVVKENDKVVENETKRNVERSSSHHGSSDEETDNIPIKVLHHEVRTSPIGRVPDNFKPQSPAPPHQEAKSTGLMARTLFDYQAAEPDELSFDVDDLITNIEKPDAGWYEGTITYKDGRKKRGLFPANHVKLLNDTDEY